MIKNSLAEEISKRRKLLNVTQEQLADMAEVGLRTLKSIETGRGNPTLSTILKLTDVLGLDLNLEIKKIGL